MFLALVMLVLVYVKNNVLYDNSTLTYLFSFGIPFDILVLVGGICLYLKYISKLQDSHPKIFANLTVALSVFTLSIMVFGIMFAMYLDNPQ